MRFFHAFQMHPMSIKALIGDPATGRFYNAVLHQPAESGRVTQANFKFKRGL